PYGPYAPSAQYKIGLYYQAHKEYQLARDEFEKTLNDYPDSKWAESARYQIAASDAKRSVGAQYDQKITNVAVQGFEEFVKGHPESELSKEAQDQIGGLRVKEAENNYVIGQFYEKQKKFPSAKIYYELVMNKYGDTAWAAKALERIQVMAKGKK
ncbi:MAG: outer membrane protein assembly factor BamD, partial [Candidatus Omnitrophica bacterium]|nr:outer membrane protein assembly factor BamD [Candidatus Omnitrophota bacterium]